MGTKRWSLDSEAVLRFLQSWTPIRTLDTERGLQEGLCLQAAFTSAVQKMEELSTVYFKDSREGTGQSIPMPASWYLHCWDEWNR